MKKLTDKKTIKLATETVRVLRDDQIAMAEGAKAANNTFLCPPSMTGYTCR